MYFKPKDLVSCISRYGDIHTSEDKKLFWPNASKWIKPYYFPKHIADVLTNSANGARLERIFCNTDIHEPLDLVCELLLDKQCYSELRTFDGCYHVRYIRGSSTVLSLHSFGIALDFNAQKNPLGGKSSWSEKFIRCWTDVGFIWGGDFKSRKDPMHFQWCGTSDSSMKLVA